MLTNELPVDSSAAARLLFIDDEDGIQRYLRRNLPDFGYEAHFAGHWDEASEYLGRDGVKPDIIFLEPQSGVESSLEDLEALQGVADETPIVVISSERRPGMIVKAIQSGAHDYIVKPFQLARLKETVDRILTERESESDPLPVATSTQANPKFVVANKAMKRIQRIVARMADMNVPVLLQGESGVGKDIIAREVHRLSKLSNQPFVKVNCAALPVELTESELFGHTRGAFTGAQSDRMGRFVQANGGTIFLDEIGEFPPSTQAKLLHVLQDGCFTRLGANEEVQVEVRVIAATNRNLEEAIRNKEFRTDLYYRLNVVNIEVPPLRERMDEVPLFCDYFLHSAAQQMGIEARELPESLMQAFQQYDWPGNVRELENMVKRFLVLEDSAAIESELATKSQSQLFETIDEMADEHLERLQQGWSLKRIAKEAASRVERCLIISTLTKTKWNKWQAAKELGVSYKTLLTRIEQYQIAP